MSCVLRNRGAKTRYSERSFLFLSYRDFRLVFFYILRGARANVAARVLEALAVSTAGNGQGGPASTPCT